MDFRKMTTNSQPFLKSWDRLLKSSRQIIFNIFDTTNGLNLEPCLATLRPRNLNVAFFIVKTHLMFPVNTTLEKLKKSNNQRSFWSYFDRLNVIGLEKLSNVFKLFSVHTKTQSR